MRFIDTTFFFSLSSLRNACVDIFLVLRNRAFELKCADLFLLSKSDRNERMKMVELTSTCDIMVNYVRPFNVLRGI
ncbi:hypothetical protein PUN28_001842 [Cardiocondyla obscurior]|uniref:Uncharacterized protein n=1 Tax=Cardiocondyla obscurior TaxID=286306 RepID=A0AAW2GRI9_9HYME